MFTKTKFVKHCTNYINSIMLLIIALISLSVSSSSAQGLKKKGWTIVIDPGHGGRDPGAVGSVSYEKNIVLPVALKTGERLEKNIDNVKIIYTRKSDIYVDLNERAEIANRNNADLFISIHANLITGTNAYGAETYVMGHAKDDQNLEVAMKENEVIILDNNYSTKYEGFDPKSPESYIMFTLMQNAFAEQSTDLAAKIQAQFRDKVKRYDRGVKQGPFWVLWKTTMPSVLTELGFISNKNEEKYMNTRQGQDSLATAIFRACREYISEIERKSSITTAKADTQAAAVTVKTETGLKGKTMFMVQVTASTKKIEIKSSNFRNINDISEIHSGNRFRYVSGSFAGYEEAVVYRKKIENIYPDAFVIAVKDNKILPLQQAIESNTKKSK